MAVASTGPACTGRPDASAVAWFRYSLRQPPPTTWMPRTGSPVSDSIVRTTDA